MVTTTSADLIASSDQRCGVPSLISILRSAITATATGLIAAAGS
jgi:hypothetical protein